MSVSPRRALRDVRLLVWAPAVGVLLVAALAYRHGLVPLDEGAVVHTADRLAHGEVLYRDVATGVAPFAYYLVALVFGLLGPSLIVARLLAALVLALATWLVQRISARFVGEPGASLAAIVFAAVNLYGYRHLGYSPISIVWHLVGVLLLIRHGEGGRRRTLYAAGAALALCALSKQNYGVLALLGAVIGLFLVTRARREPKGFAIRDTIGLAVAAAPFLLVVVVGLASVGALDDMVRYGVQGPVAGTGIAFYKPYPLLDPARPLFFAEDLPEYAPFPPATELLPRRRWRRPFLAMTTLVFVAPLALLAVALGRLRRGLAHAGDPSPSRRRLEVRAIVVPSACLIFLGVFPRSDFSHLALVSPLLVVVGADLVAGLPRWPRRAAVLSAVVVAIASAAPPLLEIAGLGASPPSERLGLARARFIRARAEDARSLRAVVEGLRRRGRPDDPVLVVPMDPLVYFLSGRPNPTSYPLVLPGAFDLEPFAAALERVDTVVLRDTGFDAVPLFQLMPDVYSLLRKETRVDPEFLDRLGGDPGQQPLVLLERARARPGEARPDPLSGLELIAEGIDQPALEGRILNAAERVHQSTFEEEARLEPAEWLLEPALRLRPPSGWQKLTVAFEVRPQVGSSLELALAHRPPPPGDPRLRELGAGPSALDGVGFEVWVWRSGGRRLELLASTRVGAGEWRWRPLSLDLSGFAERDTVIVVAVSSGPTLEELGDDLLVGRPRVLDAGRRRLAVRSFDPANLPGAVIDELVRFTDTSLFEQRPGDRWSPAARARALRNRGLVEAGLGREEQGRSLLEAALELEPEDLETLHAAAELALSTGRPELANARFETLLERRPDHLRALEMTARLAFDRGDEIEARRRALLARRLAPGSADAALLLARIAEGEGHPEAALELLAPLVGGPPGNVRQMALEMLNRAQPDEEVRIGGRVLTRVREPLPRSAFAAGLDARDVPMRRATPGQPLRFEVEVVNRSSETWPALGNEDGSTRVAVGYRFVDERTGRQHSEGRLPLPRDLAPGEVERFRFEGAAPREPGRWLLVLDVLQEGVTWFTDNAAPAGSEPLILPFQVRPTLFSEAGADDEDSPP